MQARYNSTCSFCDRQIIAGKHTISRAGKKWLHTACVEALNDGVIPTSVEDMGKDSCGICYGCLKLRVCVDAHTRNEPEPLETRGSGEEDEECHGCINHLDADSAHTCTKAQANQHHLLSPVFIDEDYCHGCENGLDADSAHTCGGPQRSMTWRWNQDVVIGW